MEKTLDYLAFLFKIENPVRLSRTGPKDEKIKYTGPEAPVRILLSKNEKGQYNMSYIDTKGTEFVSTSVMIWAKKAINNDSFIIGTADGALYFVQ